MHEASIMQSVFEIAFERMLEEGADRIHRLRLRVGALSGVAPEALAFAFEALKTDTPAAQAELEIEQMPAVLYCPACRREFEPELDGLVEACPDCGGWQTDVLQGRELDVVRLELACKE